MMGYYSNWGNMMWGFGLFGWLTALLFLILLILGVLVLWRYLNNPMRGTEAVQTPLEILKERYARGEINKKEFEDKKKDLS